MIPCGCWDGDGDGTEGRQHWSGGATTSERRGDVDGAGDGAAGEGMRVRETDGDGAGMTGSERDGRRRSGNDQI